MADPMAGFFNERKRGGEAYDDGPNKFARTASGGKSKGKGNKGGSGPSKGGKKGGGNDFPPPSKGGNKGGKGAYGPPGGGGGGTVSFRDPIPAVRAADELHSHLQGHVSDVSSMIKDLRMLDVRFMHQHGTSLRGAACEAWELMNGLLSTVPEPVPAWEDPKLLSALAKLQRPMPSQLDTQLAQNLYRRGHYVAHYTYLSMYPEYHPSMNQREGDDLPKVLMVAEKPSIAKIVAEHLSGGRLRTRKTMSRACQTFEFVSYFEPAQTKCKIIVTSVIGHVFGLSFKQQKGLDPGAMYKAEVQKHAEESTVKMRVIEHLQALAEECEYMALWLDCDKEGENICFEVISVCREHFQSDANIYRAHFSAITKPEIEKAFKNLGRPNKFMAMAVDARQELDLKVGVSFTRLLTRTFLDAAKTKFPRLDLKVLSYGPCQTPTLYFCVQRHKEILDFNIQQWYQPVFTHQGVTFEHEKIFEDWSGEWSSQAHVSNRNNEPKTLRRPVGLNTVQMLKAASALGISPGAAMKVAEELYSQGYMSYPRTESTKYPPSFDVTSVLNEQAHHPKWGKTVQVLLRASGGHIRPPSGGTDKGDHPPITPMRMAGQNEFTKNKQWRLYDYVCRHFIGSLMEDVSFTEHTTTAMVDGVPFIAKWHTIQNRGFLYSMPWKADALNVVERDVKVPENMNVRVDVNSGHTKPPDWLKEGELISLMDEHGIGTDASMATHIENVGARNYVCVCGPSEETKKPGMRIMEKGKGKGKGKDGTRPSSRHLVPTGLGLAILDMFQRLLPDLCEPPVRAYMEKQVAQISDGEATKEDVLRENLAMFEQKFKVFRSGLNSVRCILEPRNTGYNDPVHSSGGGGGHFGGKKGGKGGKGGAPQWGGQQKRPLSSAGGKGGKGNKGSKGSKGGKSGGGKISLSFKKVKR